MVVGHVMTLSATLVVLLSVWMLQANDDILEHILSR